MNLLFHLLDDSVYGIEDPGYLVNNPIFTMSKRESIPIPIDKYGFSVANLEKTQANVAVVTPNHQFPSGIIMGIRRSQRLINWANEKRNRYIIEDSYDSDFKYSGKPVAALKSLDHEDKVILSGSFSQTMGHFIRVAYLVLPKALKEKLALQKSISSTASRFDQEILSRFMGSGDFDRHLSRMNTYYRKKHDLIMKLAKNMDGIQVIGADAGLHVVLRLHGIRKDSPEHKRFDQSLRQENIIMDTVDRYSVVATNTIDYIIGFGSIPLEQLKVAIEKLEKCIANVIN